MNYQDLANAIADLKIGLPHGVPGWCCPEKCMALASLVVAHRPAVSVEIGVYGGSSFLPMALAHKAINFGLAIGIDPWDKTVAIANQTENESREHWSREDLQKVYEGFQHDIKRLGLDTWTRIYRQQSNAVQPPAAISLLHVDGGHNEQAVTDVMRFGPRVIVGGYCVLDDLDWTGGAVRRAEQRLMQFGFYKRYVVGTGAVYQRTR